MGVAQLGPEHTTCDVVPVEIIDLAVRGIGFKVCTPLTPGALLSIELRVPGVAPQTWHCRVIRVHPLDETQYYVGAAFEHVS
jgi:hypothetical protein